MCWVGFLCYKASAFLVEVWRLTNSTWGVEACEVWLSSLKFLFLWGCVGGFHRSAVGWWDRYPQS